MKSLLFFLLSFISFNKPIEDCSCVGSESIEQAFKGSDLVFWGKVDSITYVSLKETVKEEKVKELEEKIGDDISGLWNTTWLLKVSVKPTKVFKGKKQNKDFIIYTPRSGSTCGFRFEKGKEYVIYALNKSEFYSIYAFEDIPLKGNEKENTYWTNHCSNTGIYNKTEVKTLKKLQKKLK
jgi:hypothetical protein